MKAFLYQGEFYDSQDDCILKITQERDEYKRRYFALVNELLEMKVAMDNTETAVNHDCNPFVLSMKVEVKGNV